MAAPNLNRFMNINTPLDEVGLCFFLFCMCMLYVVVRVGLFFFFFFSSTRVGVCAFVFPCPSPIQEKKKRVSSFFLEEPRSHFEAFIENTLKQSFVFGGFSVVQFPYLPYTHTDDVHTISFRNYH